MNAIKIAGSKFVVLVVALREVDRGGAPHYGPEQIIAVADTLEEARTIALRFPAGPAEVRILEVFPPVDAGIPGSLRFLAPIRRAVVEPKVKPAPKAKAPRKPRKAA